MFGLVLVLSVLGYPAAAEAAPQGNVDGRIAFDSVREGVRNIYAIDPPTPSVPSPAPTQLSFGGADARPSWSPPGITDIQQNPPPPRWATALAFQRTFEGNTDIYRVLVPPSGAPTAQPERVTTHPAADTAPSWAPEFVPGTPERPVGTHPPIAFERDINGNRDIFIANSDGSDETNLTSTPESDEANPDWAFPVRGLWGRQAGGSGAALLAFDSNRSGRRDIWVMEVRYNAAAAPPYEPAALHNVTAGQPTSLNPSWYVFAPGSTPLPRIAFSGPDQDGGNSQIHSMELQPVAPFTEIDTSSLTSDAAEEAAPAWSPLGTRIAYESTRDQNSEIYVMDPDGPDETDTNVTRFPGPDRNPDWEAPVRRNADAFPVRPRGRRARRRARQAIVQLAPPDLAPSAGTSPPTQISPRCTRTASARTHVLRGTRRRDVLCGTAGNDIINAGRGNDVIRARGGHDVIRAGPGDDVVDAGGGQDDVRGGSGNDRLNGGAGRDDVSGGPGRDRLTARDRRRDRISGGPGNDRARIDLRLDRVASVERLQP